MLTSFFRYRRLLLFLLLWGACHATFWAAGVHRRDRWERYTPLENLSEPFWPIGGFSTHGIYHYDSYNSASGTVPARYVANRITISWGYYESYDLVEFLIYILGACCLVAAHIYSRSTIGRARLPNVKETDELRDDELKDLKALSGCGWRRFLTVRTLRWGFAWSILMAAFLVTPLETSLSAAEIFAFTFAVGVAGGTLVGVAAWYGLRSLAKRYPFT